MLLPLDEAQPGMQWGVSPEVDEKVVEISAVVTGIAVGPITANTVYVASYHCDSGHYSADFNYFSSTSGEDNPPLHALPSTSSNGNGVYAYGVNGNFPNQSWNSGNYWVDVVFQQ